MLQRVKISQNDIYFITEKLVEDQYTLNFQPGESQALVLAYGNKIIAYFWGRKRGQEIFFISSLRLLTLIYFGNCFFFSLGTVYPVYIYENTKQVPKDLSKFLTQLNFLSSLTAILISVCVRASVKT